MIRYLPLLFFVPALLFSKSSLKVKTDGKAVVLINADTGSVLYEKNADLPVYPASITKVVTALYALEKRGEQLDENMTASADAVLCVAAGVRRAWEGKHPPHRLEYGGSYMGIQPLETLSFRTLLYGLMLASGNDAANVIAECISGTVPAFMNEVNRYAAQMGCKNSQFYNPHGLPHPLHKTTARDMAILTKRALSFPFFREVVKSLQYYRPASNKQKDGLIKQHNALLKPGPFFYQKAIGVKTGYTEASGYTLVAAAENGERKLIAVILGCEKMEQRYKDAIALFEGAFMEPKMTRTLFAQGFDFFSCEITGGKSGLEATLEDDVRITFFPSEEPLVYSEVSWDNLQLPILKGQKVGRINIYENEGRLIASESIFAMRPVEPTLSHQIHLIISHVKGTMREFTAIIVAILGLTVIALAYANSRKRFIQS